MSYVGTSGATSHKGDRDIGSKSHEEDATYGRPGLDYRDPHYRSKREHASHVEHGRDMLRVRHTLMVELIASSWGTIGSTIRVAS